LWFVLDQNTLPGDKVGQNTTLLRGLNVEDVSVPWADC